MELKFRAKTESEIRQSQLRDLAIMVECMEPGLQQDILLHHISEMTRVEQAFEQDRVNRVPVGLQPPSFIAFHKTETGYKTLAEVNNWIARQPDPDEYYVKQCFGDTPSCAYENTRNWDEFRVQQRIKAAVERERKRISDVLFSTGG
jgi:hypothetical protein